MRPLLSRRLHLRVDPERLDWTVAAATTVAAQLEVWLARDFSGHRPLDAVLALLVTGAVAFRRRYPLAAGAATLAQLVELGFVDDAQNMAVAVAYFCLLYGVAVWTSRRRFVVALVVLVASNLATAVAGPRLALKDAVPFTVVTVVGMLLVRRVIGDRERRLQLAERERDVAAREAVVAERARIARELHDVVAHSVSVMVVQAQAGPRLLDEPERARDTFGSIETAGREALVELRRLLGVLRGGDEHAATAPQPGLNALDGLLAQVREAGLRVDLRTEGVPLQLPAGVDLSAYRIVQEALTNALRHAGRAEAEVIVRYRDRSLELEILDNGLGADTRVNGSGHGLVGMRERVALYGGSLETGSRNGHGFAVRASLPLTPEPTP
ncbi:MAG TPA: sensor histidine kinase [Gaiellaceae bacterium]|nr:sensor histidine kinase [Gaiellaceae bacterium]